MTESRINYSLEVMDQRSVFHPLTSISDHTRNGPTIIERSQGVTLHSRGQELIDCSAGLWCVNVGYGRPEIADAAAQAMRDLNYYHIFGGASNEPVIRLADRVLGLLHDHAGAPDMARVFFGCSGSDANDTNIKLVRYYNNLKGRPRKKKIIARTGAYHGLTAASAALTGIPVYHKAWDLAEEGIIHTSCPHHYRYGEPGETLEAFTDRMISEIEEIIEREGADTIAAFIAEPIMGTGGVILPLPGYFERLQKLLSDNDILFIADEVITGFGRAGSWFGTGLYNLKPDIITLAKGITSAYFPVSACVIGQKIWEALEAASPEHGPVMHGFTYSGHPVGAAVGMANISILEREALPAASKSRGEHLLARVRERFSEHPYIGDIRGQGLMVGLEFVADRERRRFFAPGTNPHRVVAERGSANGLMIRPLPFLEVLAFSPPLTITESQCDAVVDRFAHALDKAEPELRKLAGLH